MRGEPSGWRGTGFADQGDHKAENGDLALRNGEMNTVNIS